ncbi:MAG: TIGR00730 family Rossman fold protein [Bacteroidales bacterium]
MKNICVFCGSSTGSDPVYSDAASELGSAIAAAGFRLIYGGASVGIMGILADSTLKVKGEVIGVIPSFFSKKEIAHNNLSELIFVESMHERKLKMAELSDGFIALPGGYGTLDELFEMLTWSQLDLHQKPIGLLNVKGYFDPLISLFDKMTEEKFLKPAHRQMILCSENSSDLLQMMQEYQPVRLEKWLNRIKA